MKRNPIVLLDPGHGGEDPGTTSDDLEVDEAGDWQATFIESQVVLDVAQRAQAKLRAHGVTAPLTRGTDDFTSPQQRREVERRHQPAFVLSLHVNANPSPDFYTWDSFYWPGNAKGADLARMASETCPVDLGPGRVFPARIDDPDDLWLQRPRNVLSWYASTAVLFEMGFRTNLASRDFMLSDEGRERCAYTVAYTALRGLEMLK